MPIKARYHDARNRVVAAVDNFRAEPVFLSFKKDGAQDPARPARQIEAILQVATSDEVMPSGGVDRDWRRRISVQQSELHVDRSAYPGLIVSKGDLVRAIARSGEPWFEVLAVDDRSEPRLVLKLGEG